MHFGLDLRPALLKPTGVGRYAVSLASRLPARAPDDRFTFFSSSFKDRFPPLDLPPNAVLVDRRWPVKLLNLAWNRLGWPPLDTLVGESLDLIHSPHPLIVPGRRAKHIVTIHDLFFLKHPELTSAEIRRDYAPLVAEHVRRADAVICVSEYTAGEAQLMLEVPRDKIGVIPNGVDPAFREKVADEDIERLLKKRRLPRGALLYVGSDEKRKNLVNLAIAFLGLARRRRSSTPPLILVGPGSHWARVEPGRARIYATPHLPPDELRALMASATALILPSLEEGFGLPVVEAMAAGLPVICSRGSALEEVAGDAATLVNPLDTGSIADGIERLVDDSDLAAEQRQRGIKRSAAYDWDASAGATLAFYRRVLAA
jgi:alpha-1,3-rhamnosyl/mannosyltransferase